MDTGIARTIEVQVRYCEDCRWYRNTSGRPILATCSHPLLDRGNRVMYMAQEASCTYERTKSGDCGVEGKLFQRKMATSKPVKPWWRFW